jgi:hypothetical protein
MFGQTSAGSSERPHLSENLGGISTQAFHATREDFRAQETSFSELCGVILVSGQYCLKVIFPHCELNWNIESARPPWYLHIVIDFERELK